MTPHALAHELERLYGEELEAIVLYGSAVGRDYSKKYSDYNIFCVLRQISPTLLARANRVIRRWMRKGNPAILFFDPAHIRRSLDVFPLEFMDMKDRHEALLGRDPLAGIEVNARNLRHQCESELKGKLIHLRSFFAANCHKPRHIAQIMIDSFPTFLAAMRGTLRLLGETPPAEARAVVEMLSTRVGMNGQAFFDIIDMRRGDAILPRGEEALGLFERYLTELSTLTTYVDQLEV